MRVSVSKRGRKDIDKLPLPIRNQVMKEVLLFEANPGSVDLKKIETKKDLYRILRLPFQPVFYEEIWEHEEQTFRYNLWH